VAWYSPAEPHAHVLGESDCDSDVRIVDDHVAWINRDELVVSDLAGRTRTLASFPRGTAGPHFAFDGRRFALAAARCDGRDTLRVSRRRWDDDRPVRCPGRLTSRTAVVRRGVARLPMHCPRGCSGDFRLPFADYIEQPFSVRRGATHARLHLDFFTWYHLRRKGAARLRVKLSFDDRNGESRPQRRVRLRLAGLPRPLQGRFRAAPARLRTTYG
jgi:hypothetical protein